MHCIAFLTTPFAPETVAIFCKTDEDVNLFRIDKIWSNSGRYAMSACYAIYVSVRKENEAVLRIICLVLFCGPSLRLYNRPSIFFVSLNLFVSHSVASLIFQPHNLYTPPSPYISLTKPPGTYPYPPSGGGAYMLPGLPLSLTPRLGGGGAVITRSLLRLRRLRSSTSLASRNLTFLSLSLCLPQPHLGRSTAGLSHLGHHHPVDSGPRVRKNIPRPRDTAARKLSNLHRYRVLVPRLRRRFQRGAAVRESSRLRVRSCGGWFVRGGLYAAW
jgi:hypothetical protein